MSVCFRCTMRFLVSSSCCLSLILTGQMAFAQGFGVELHNNLTPAAGGMGGTSIAEPQDLLAAINGNPANVTQFQGTQFTFLPRFGLRCWDRFSSLKGN